MWSLLEYRGVIEVSGQDRVAFLNGLVTQDVAAVTDGPVYSLMLTPKGRFAFDFFIIGVKDALWLTPGKVHLHTFIKKLMLYKLQSDVDIRVLEDHVVAVRPDKDLAVEAGVTFLDPRDKELGYVFVGPKSQVQYAKDSANYEARRLRLNVPEGPLDLEWEKTIPLEAQMDRLNAISWTKGCFLGQELTARTKHVGVVRKMLCAFTADLPVKIDAPVEADGHEIGTIKSLYKNGTAGFALVRKEAATGPLSVGSISVSLVC